jgi:aldose 1-epimerase
MARFTVDEGRFGSLDTIRLTDPGTGASAVIARRGATLLSWIPAPGDGRPSDHVDGYLDEAELVEQAGVRSGVMAPFSNRIRGGRYPFDGETHDLLPGVPEPQRTAYHGFLREIDCTVVDVGTGESEARLRLATDAVRPGAFAGYPFAIDLEVGYTLTATGLTLDISGHNVGDRVAPYGCGWHPYFRLGTRDVDLLELQVPARTMIRTDPDLIPLADTQAFVPLADTELAGFAGAAAIGDAVLDVAFAHLVAEPDGIIRTRLRDPRTGRTLVVSQHAGLMHVFTGDTLDREPRTSVALEPVELMTDAFNRPDCRQAITLEPGARRDFRCGVEITTPG